MYEFSGAKNETIVIKTTKAMNASERGDVTDKLIKDFNLKENSDSAWLSWSELANDEKIPEDLELRYAIGGMYAADSIDLNSAKLIGMRPDDPKIYVRSMYWIPQTAPSHPDTPSMTLLQYPPISSCATMLISRCSTAPSLPLPWRQSQ